MNVDEAQELRILSRRITVALVVVAVVAMVFTAVSVTTFALDHGVSPWVAWTLDPMVAVALLVVLLADARLVELGTAPSGWATALRWFAGMATWAMNSWQSFWPDGGFGVPRDVDPAGVVLHSVAPVLLVVLAEAATGYRRVIAARLRVLEGVESAGSFGELATHGRPHLEVVVDDFGNDVPEVESSWDEPWRAPWGNELPEASAVGSFRDLTDDHPETLRLPSKMVTPVVGGWSSVDAQTATTGDRLDDQAHDHPGTFWDPGKMVAPVVAAEIFGGHRNDQADDHPDDQGWAPVPTLGDQAAEVFRASPENFRDDPNRSRAATVAEGYAPVRTPAADHFPTWESDDVGGTDPIGEGSGLLPTPAPEGFAQTEPLAGDEKVADLRPFQAELSDADLKRAARRLLRESVRTTGRPVTVDALRDELGLSRRRAIQLRRDVLGTAS